MPLMAEISAGMPAKAAEDYEHDDLSEGQAR